MIAGVLGAALFGATLALALYALAAPSDGAAPGMLIGDQVAPAEEPLGDWLERRRVVLMEHEAYLALPDETVEVTLGDLGVEVDVAETMALVAGRARQTGFIGRAWRVLTARYIVDELPLRWRFDERRAAASLERVAGWVRREPVNARLELRLHRRIDDVPGRQLDVPATLQILRDAAPSDPAVFAPVVRAIPAKVTSSMLGNIDVSKVLSRYETSFAGKAGRRAINIAVAARYLNETVIPPGGVLSFNRTVGKRVPERGFVEAPVIVEDELEQGYGGGVCQVATTLHAAAVFGGLRILRRRSHSRPSGYAPLGLDATVIDGEVDLQIENSHDTSLIVHAFLPTKTTIRIELLGREPPGEVRHTYGVVGTHPFTRRVRVKPELGPDFVERKQKGNPGYDVVSTVWLRSPDGSTATKTYPSTYYPVPEVFWVGSESARQHDLPPLPEGAVEVPEGSPEEMAGTAQVDTREASPLRADPLPDPYESRRN